MALKGRTSRTFLFITILVVEFSLFLQLVFFELPIGTLQRETVQAAPVPASTRVAPDTVQNVFVENVLDLPVVQQPVGDAFYVSPNHGELTQYAAVSQYGNIGLLAHNYLAGRFFSRLELGQEVQLRYQNGQTESFVITEILRYQALQPRSPYSAFQNIDNASEVLSVRQMVDRVYRGSYHLTLQTCIFKDGDSSWGRLFILATPKAETPNPGSLDLQAEVNP